MLARWIPAIATQNVEVIIGHFDAASLGFACVQKALHYHKLTSTDTTPPECCPPPPSPTATPLTLTRWSSCSAWRRTRICRWRNWRRCWPSSSRTTTRSTSCATTHSRRPQTTCRVSTPALGMLDGLAYRLLHTWTEGTCVVASSFPTKHPMPGIPFTVGNGLPHGLHKSAPLLACPLACPCCCLKKPAPAPAPGTPLQPALNTCSCFDLDRPCSQDLHRVSGALLHC